MLFFPLGRPASWRMLAMHPSLQGRREPARPSLEELQALADAMTGGGVRLRDPVWRTYFGLQHRHATRYRDRAACSWPGTPPTSTVPPAPRA